MRRSVVLLLVGLEASLALGGEALSFRSPGLKAAVEGQLHVSNPTPADMLKLAYLVAEGREIADLAVLEHATNLATLNLSNNAIADLAALAPLAGITRLQFLDLTGNQIADVAPLAGLVALAELHLADNRRASLPPLPAPAAVPLASILPATQIRRPLARTT